MSNDEGMTNIRDRRTTRMTRIDSVWRQLRTARVLASLLEVVPRLKAMRGRIALRAKSYFFPSAPKTFGASLSNAAAAATPSFLPLALLLLY
jgi:hypothetical protein